MKVSLALSLILAIFLLAPHSGLTQDFKAILAHPERPAGERALDASRKPEEVLRFYGVKPGDRVADLMASRGYYTVILSLLVGEKGMVFSADATIRKELRERVQNAAFANVKLVEGPLDQVGLPADGSLDFVLIHLDYHEVAQEARKAMNRRVFAALKPGGTYGVIDHSATEGSGDEVRKSLHRIDKAMVVQEVTEAGFVLANEGEMLRNPQDTRTESVFRDRGKSDRFVLRFERAR